MLPRSASWPSCGRSACRSAANTRSVPSRPSTLIAAVMSAVVSRLRRSWMARTSMPSIPSVPLISASPSFSCSVIGSARRRLVQFAVRVAHRTLADQRERAMGERREVPGAPERAVLVHDRREVADEHPRVGGRRLRPHAGPAGGERGEAQEHQRADDLPLDLGAAAGRVAADQAALELRCACRWGCGAWRGRRSRWRRRSAAWVGGERVDRPRGCGRSPAAPRRQLDGRVVAGDGDDVSRVGAPTPIVTVGRVEHARHQTTARARPPRLEG